MNTLLTGALLIAAVIHLLPLPGVLGQGKLSKLYGLAAPDPGIELLLRHRAVLFGLLGALLAVAAFQASIQVLALVGGIASTASFLVLSRQVRDCNAQLSRVVVADIIALVSLLIGAAAYVLDGRV